MSLLWLLVQRGVNWLRRRNCLTIAAFCLISFLLWALFSLANQTGTADAHPFDRAVLMAVRVHGAAPLGGGRLQELMGQLTSFGDHAVVTTIVIIAGFYLLLSGRVISAFVVAGAATSGALLIKLLKIAFIRRFHDFDYSASYQIMGIWADSFPSGHATIAAIVYLTLGCLLAVERKTQILQTFTISVAIALTCIVGVSRVFIGVHYPTDVFGGWCIGAAWALLWIAIGDRIARKKARNRND